MYTYFLMACRHFSACTFPPLYRQPSPLAPPPPPLQPRKENRKREERRKSGTQSLSTNTTPHHQRHPKGNKHTRLKKRRSRSKSVRICTKTIFWIVYVLGWQTSGNNLVELTIFCTYVHVAPALYHNQSKKELPRSISASSASPSAKIRQIHEGAFKTTGVFCTHSYSDIAYGKASSQIP